jgi:hypothetical protein
MIYYLIKERDLITLDNEEAKNYFIKEEGYKEYNEDSFEVQKLLNIPEKNKQMEKLKKLLTETDYKVIKCYESFMRQQTLPYNLEELSAQRDAWREEINQLEQELAELE